MARTSPKRLSPDEIAAALVGDLARWRLEGGALVRVYRCNGWKSTLMAVNAIGHLAELAWHHPEIRASYGRVETRLDTHESKGVTARDIELARKIEAVLGWRPGAEGGVLEGTPDDPANAYLLPDD
jgi:4a-hydroxytetrahydrobiopterin dehydratase